MATQPNPQSSDSGPKTDGSPINDSAWNQAPESQNQIHRPNDIGWHGTVRHYGKPDLPGNPNGEQFSIIHPMHKETDIDAPQNPIPPVPDAGYADGGSLQQTQQVEEAPAAPPSWDHFQNYLDSLLKNYDPSKKANTDGTSMFTDKPFDPSSSSGFKGGFPGSASSNPFSKKDNPLLNQGYGFARNILLGPVLQDKKVPFSGVTDRLSSRTQGLMTYYEAQKALSGGAPSPMGDLIKNYFSRNVGNGQGGFDTSQISQYGNQLGQAIRRQPGTGLF